MDGEKDFGPKIAKEESYILLHMHLFLLTFIYIYTYMCVCVCVCSALGVPKFMMLLHK